MEPAGREGVAPVRGLSNWRGDDKWHLTSSNSPDRPTDQERESRTRGGSTGATKSPMRRAVGRSCGTFLARPWEVLKAFHGFYTPSEYSASTQLGTVLGTVGVGELRRHTDELLSQILHLRHVFIYLAGGVSREGWICSPTRLKSSALSRGRTRSAM